MAATRKNQMGLTRQRSLEATANAVRITMRRLAKTFRRKIYKKVLDWSMYKVFCALIVSDYLLKLSIEPIVPSTSFDIFSISSATFFVSS